MNTLKTIAGVLFFALCLVGPYALQDDPSKPVVQIEDK